MDNKKNKILNVVIAGKDLTKLEIKTQTGYSYTTVIKAVDELCAEGLITCGTRAVKCGKAPSVINVNPDSVVLGIAVTKNSIMAVNSDLEGKVRHFFECAVTKDATEQCISVINKLCPNEPPKRIGIIDKENITEVKRVAETCGAPCESYGNAEGLAWFYRIFALNCQKDVCVIYIDEKITMLYSGEKTCVIEVGTLYSPIMNAKTGRMTYDEVLAESNVKQRLSQRFHAELCALEAAEDDGIFLYRERLELAASELCMLADKLLTPAAIVVGGSYIGKSVLLKIKEKGINATAYFAGNTDSALAQCAVAAALGCLR